MKKFIASAFLCFAGFLASAQFIYKIKADSILMTNDTCNAELNLENGTRNVKGFLYNKGNGRTEFRRGAILVNDTLVIGDDSLSLNLFGGGGSSTRFGVPTEDPSADSDRVFQMFDHNFQINGGTGFFTIAMNDGLGNISANTQYYSVMGGLVTNGTTTGSYGLNNNFASIGANYTDFHNQSIIRTYPDSIVLAQTDGLIRFTNFGSGTITGTPSYLLAVNAAGDVIETSLGNGGGGGGEVTADNGLTLIGGNIEWGGTLLGNTTIDQGVTNSLTFSNVSNFLVLGNSVATYIQVDDANSRLNLAGKDIVQIATVSNGLGITLDGVIDKITVKTDSIFLETTLSGATSGMVWTLADPTTGSGYWGAGGGGGGGDGNGIYTGSGTLSGNVNVDLDAHILNFFNGTSSVMNLDPVGGSYGIGDLGAGSGSGSYLTINDITQTFYFQTLGNNIITAGLNQTAIKGNSDPGDGIAVLTIGGAPGGSGSTYISSIVQDRATPSDYFEIDFESERFHMQNQSRNLFDFYTDGGFAIFSTPTPSAGIGDGVVLYAEDVSASSELRVRDEAGNVTTLSPHNFSHIPEGKSEEMAWSFYSEKDAKYVNVDMMKLVRLVEKITGEKLVYTGKLKK